MSSKASGLASHKLARVLQTEMIAPGLNRSFSVLLAQVLGAHTTALAGMRGATR